MTTPPGAKPATPNPFERTLAPATRALAADPQLQVVFSTSGPRLEGTKMLWAEKRLARRFDLCTATTRAEWQTLDGYGTGAATDWFPNGVDAGYFSPASAPCAT